MIGMRERGPGGIWQIVVILELGEAKDFYQEIRGNYSIEDHDVAAQIAKLVKEKANVLGDEW